MFRGEGTRILKSLDLPLRHLSGPQDREQYVSVGILILSGAKNVPERLEAGPVEAMLVSVFDLPQKKFSPKNHVETVE